MVSSDFAGRSAWNELFIGTDPPPLHPPPRPYIGVTAFIGKTAYIIGKTAFIGEVA